ncbi:MAG: glycosyltransferase family 2 protein [bacterium]|nr:glycosyltransferase family 2 protein [bacterium]
MTQDSMTIDSSDTAAGVRRAKSSKILVFVVAYRAERHLVSVFERVPAHLFDDPRIHFLVIDDASGDAGPDLLQAWIDERGIESVTVTRNPMNQGYGGNQKLGYRQAIDAGYDFTILLHGDGQYAPELLPRFIETWERTGADVVLGSRMGDLASARAGGMPLYKLVGNQVLTRFQNLLTGRNLSEYHTGYRGYSSAFLAKVPFEINTNDFHFDTEILLQAMHVGASVEEFDIPTHYGDEDCHVDGLEYAWNVTLETLRYRMHRMGMRCSLRYRNLDDPPWRSQTGSAAPYSAHRMASEALQALSAHTVLDIGCGAAIVAGAAEAMGAEVTGIDRQQPTSGRLHRFLKADLDDPLPVDPFEYDAVLLLDILEELEDPEGFLLALRNRSRVLRPGAVGPAVLVATPNVAFLTNRIALLFGRFNYGDRGILDIAHKRLMNRASLLRMLRDCGYEIEWVRGVPIPWEAVIGGRLGRWLERVSTLLAKYWQTMFGFQLLVQCRPLPGVEQVLGDRERLAPAADPSHES